MVYLRRISGIGLIAAFVVAVAACGGGAGDGGEEGGGGDLGSLELNLGTIMPLTGDLSQFGPGMESGGNLAAEEINACETMTVNMTNEDGGTNEQTAATAAISPAARTNGSP